MLSRSNLLGARGGPGKPGPFHQLAASFSVMANVAAPHPSRTDPSRTDQSRTDQSRNRRGLSPIAISIVLVFIGILAAFGVPRMMQGVEQSRASESFRFLSGVRTAQTRFQAEQGVYASDLKMLDLDRTAPPYFSVGLIAPVVGQSLRESWTLTLTRVGSNRVYGAYTVTFTHRGFDAANSDIAPGINPL